MMRSWRGDGSRRNLVLGSLHGGILISLSRGLQINEGFQADHVFNESILAALLRDKVKCNDETKIKKKNSVRNINTTLNSGSKRCNFKP